jgi:hypothetical protein
MAAAVGLPKLKIKQLTDLEICILVRREYKGDLVVTNIC